MCERYIPASNVSTELGKLSCVELLCRQVQGGAIKFLTFGALHLGADIAAALAKKQRLAIAIGKDILSLFFSACAHLSAQAGSALLLAHSRLRHLTSLGS